MKNILIIAGSDSVGGAGIQADLKTCEALGCYGANVITCVVAENTKRVADILVMPNPLIKAQFECILEELPIHAVKVGMLFNVDIMQLVSEFLSKINAPIVLDPVCISKAGDALIDPKAIDYLASMFKFATIATPNRFEFEKLLGSDTSSLPCDVLVKKVSSKDQSLDMLYCKDGKRQEFNSRLLSPSMIHGSGCTLSTAIACFLAKGFETKDAVSHAKDYVTRAITQALHTNFGPSLLDHKVKF